MRPARSSLHSLRPEKLTASLRVARYVGVPIAVKDLCNTKGIPTAAGMAIYKDYRPDEDATVVTRLRDAGAVLLGKLQMTEGAYGQHHPSITPPVISLR